MRNKADLEFRLSIIEGEIKDTKPDTKGKRRYIGQLKERRDTLRWVLN
jgi:hypothetical protein